MGVCHLAFSCFAIAVRFARLDLYPEDFREHLATLRLLLVPIVFSIQGLIFSAACWTSFRGKRSARGWGIAASAVIVLAGLFVVLIVWVDHDLAAFRAGLVPTLIVLGIGVSGLVAFARPVARADLQAESSKNAPVPGDGTIGIVNKLASLMAAALTWAGYSWWLRWMRSNDLSAGLNLSVEFGLLRGPRCSHPASRAGSRRGRFGVRDEASQVRSRPSAVDPVQVQMEVRIQPEDDAGPGGSCRSGASYGAAATLAWDMRGRCRTRGQFNHWHRWIALRPSGKFRLTASIERQTALLASSASPSESAISSRFVSDNIIPMAPAATSIFPTTRCATSCEFFTRSWPCRRLRCGHATTTSRPSNGRSSIPRRCGGPLIQALRLRSSLR